MGYVPPNYYEDFRGKVAIVTGASSGIGKAIAEGLSHHGARVFNLDLVYRGDITPTSKFYYNYITDVSDPDQVKRTIERIVQEEGIPEILVNNAGIEINDEGNIITMPLDSLMKVFNTNFLGYVHMLREVVPYMVKNGGGRIVNISSVQAVQSCLPGNIYQVTKQGILGLARIMTLEYAKNNIRTNTLIPGKITTEGMGNARLDENPHALDDLIRSIPLGRGGHPQEITNAALFLLSKQASYIQGTELVVDGGLLTTLIGDQGIPNPPVINNPDFG